MLEKLKKYISAYDLIRPGEKILLAVSGGIDSMVMCHLLLQLDIVPGIAHCNFMLRDEDSEKDEKFVQEYAKQWKIPFHSKRFDTISFAGKNSLSVQMAARDLRYKWFEELRVEHNYKKIAVAHNLNDNIETLFINLIRGTGISGLTGMKPLVNNIVRPLLYATREDISLYCHKNEVAFREDKSNADTKYTRNKIRHLLVPLLKELNPSIEYTLNETAERFSGIEEIVTEFIAGINDKITEPDGDLLSVNISLLEKHMHNRTILYELFKPYGINNLQLNDLIKVIEGKTGGQIFTNSHRIIKNRKELIISSIKEYSDTCCIIEEMKDFSNLQNIASAEYIDLTGNFEIPSDPGIACLDSEKISFPLTIRKWKSGDYFFPLGMRQKKKLSDYFIDNKYSRIEKENKLIIESKGNIICIVGDRIDNRFRITDSTKKALVIKPVEKPLIIRALN